MGITSNKNWFNATRPEDLIPDTLDTHKRGERFLELVNKFTLTQGEMSGRQLGECILPWQEKLIRKIWGDTTPEGKRIITEAGVKIGKGSGKSTLLAAIAIATLIEWELEKKNIGYSVCIVACNIQSADISFRHIRECIALDPFLSPRFHINLSKRELTYKPTGSTIRTIAPEFSSSVGLRCGLVLGDELHIAAITSKDFSAVIDQLKRGSANAVEPLYIGVTTAAASRPEGYFMEWLGRMRSIRDELIKNESILPVLFEFPPQSIRPDLDIADSNEWWRGMPSLRTPTQPNGTMDIEALEKELEEALADADQNGVGQMELLLSQRLGLETIDRDGGSGATSLSRHWDDNRSTLAPTKDKTIWVGCDPSSGLDDPFAVVQVWRSGDDNNTYNCLSRQFLLESTYNVASNKLKAVYKKSVDCGELSLHNSVGELEAAVMAHCRQIWNTSYAVNFCGDSAGLSGFKERFEQEINTYTPVPQGWQMRASLEFAGGLAYDKKLHHIDQPLLTANVHNLVEDGGRLRKYDAGSNGVGRAKIDGCMALLSAIGEASKGNEASDFFLGMIG